MKPDHACNLSVEETLRECSNGIVYYSEEKMQSLLKK